MVPALVVGTVLSVEVSLEDPDLPRTRVLLVTDSGREVTFVLPGANGGPPAAVWGVPALSPGETWQVELVEAGAGLVPRGLGAGLSRLDGPAPPPWNLNGVTYAPEQLPLTFYLNTEGSADVGFSTTEQIVAGALEAWTSVGCSTFAFAYGGSTDAGFADDGLNVLSWEDEAWEWGEEVAGYTATRFAYTDDGGVVPAGADILFNGVGWAWTAELGDIYVNPPLLNVHSVVLHELGHAAGMDHELDLVSSTMFFAYIGGIWQGSLAGDDRRGLCEKYPTGGDECEQDEDCAGVESVDNPGRVCAEIDGIGVCEEIWDEVGDFCARTAYYCAEYCVFTNDYATEGYCTIGCEADGDCPDGWACGTADLFLYDAPNEEDTLCMPIPPDTGAPDTAAPDTAAPDEGGGGGGGAKDGGCNSTGVAGAGWGLLGALAALGRRRGRVAREEAP